MFYFTNTIEDGSTFFANFELEMTNLKLKGESVDVNTFEIKIKKGETAYRILEPVEFGGATGLGMGFSYGTE